MFSKLELEYLANIGRDFSQGGTPKLKDAEAQRAGLQSLIVAHIRRSGKPEAEIYQQIQSIYGQRPDLIAS